MKMRSLAITFFLVGLFSVSCNTKDREHSSVSTEMIRNPISAQSETDLSELPKIQFDKTEHDFGILLQGEKVSYTFVFKNIGKQDLIIKDASATCGCTVPKFTSKPIAPGKQGEIEVIFDSSNRTGRQVKTVTVWSNCQPNQAKLQIFSEIVVPNK
ncbi:MAG TPA: DUF1573 domain-containing protein [Marinilabiliales bacterium]|jgi:hypothetical protein|nr:DUF1573 domain-containing protein [Marinilabiliales bacterium]HAZ00900.1 DUF1573 domain-containing protein [Marinilabiliales bacterium]HBO76526.1 DUF1573 domain-containing protein [Marinilabiliales bacterium]HBX84509.1 DUF1573 domain-containing protein [Marinilabiliales bacterium]HBY52539.1 DUF1573 domain-containing protein [Marinilabiliales bacterium]